MTLALGFDFGEQRIGIAVGSTESAASRALCAVPRPQQEAQWLAIDACITQWTPQTLLVGLPLTMDGAAQPLTRKARHFAHQLRDRYQLPVAEVDERLTSIAARDELRSARASGGKRRRNRKGDNDSLAAALIVQQWLDEHA